VYLFFYSKASWLGRIGVQEINISHFSSRYYGAWGEKAKNERNVFK